MNRRMALFSTLLMGGLVPASLRAQQGTNRRASTKDRGPALEPAKGRRTSSGELAEKEPADEAAGDNDPPPNLPGEPGQSWKRYDISHYTGLAQNQSTPQTAIVEWIFRRTGTSPWHSDKIAVLSASRSQIRAFHDAATLKMVDEVVERFTNAVNDILSIRVRVVAAVDPRWRYAVYSRLTPVGSGPQGQQIWTLKMDDAAFVLAQMQLHQGFKLLVNQKYEMINGQTLKVETTIARSFAGGMQRDSAAGLGYSAQGRTARRRVHPPAQPAPDLRRRRPRRGHRALVEHRPDAPSDPGQRAQPDRRQRDHGRRPRGLRDTAEPDGQGLAAGPVAPDLGRHPAGHPPGQERPLQPPDPRHLPHQHRAARLPRSRDRQPRPDEDAEPSVTPGHDPATLTPARTLDLRSILRRRRQRRRGDGLVSPGDCVYND